MNIYIAYTISYRLTTAEGLNSKSYDSEAAPCRYLYPHERKYYFTFYI